MHGDGRLFMGQRRLVGTRRAERVINIHNLKNSGEKRNFAPQQTVGISAAIEVLMMVADDGQHQAQRSQWAADIFAGDGMALHDLPFFRCEVSALFQDFIRDSDFPQIMKIAAATKGNNFFFIEQQMSSEIAGILSQSLAVAFGIWIAAFDAES